MPPELSLHHLQPPLAFARTSTSGKIGGRPGFVKGLAALPLVKFSPDLAQRTDQLIRLPGTIVFSAAIWICSDLDQTTLQGHMPMQASQGTDADIHAHGPANVVPSMDADASFFGCNKKWPKMSKAINSNCISGEDRDIGYIADPRYKGAASISRTTRAGDQELRNVLSGLSRKLIDQYLE